MNVVSVVSKKKKSGKKRKRRINAYNDYFSRNKIYQIDYRDIEILKKFINGQGRMLSQTYSKLLRKNQKRITSAIKKARQMALMPYEIVIQKIFEKEETPKTVSKS